MINFPAHPDCKACPLHETATHAGIPTRPFDFRRRKPLERKAVLVVGEAPGATEDAQNECWVGKVGKMLQGFLEVSKIGDYADIYLANACRCRPPMNVDPTVTQLNLCRPYLQADLDALLKVYKEVTILCTGRWGTTAVTKQSGLHQCFSWQGLSLSFFNEQKKGGLTGDARVFFTYHPGALLPHRQPGRITAVADHLTLLLRYLKGEFIPHNLHVIPEYNPSATPFSLKPELVAVDIETYGILKGKNQSVFHPMKSHYIDGVPLGDQIVTVAFGHPFHDGVTPYRTVVYDWKKHRPQIRKCFRRIIQSGTTLLGQHIKFDLLYLKMNDPILDRYITPNNVTLDDTLLASFLLYEQRPEKGLKELATLFGLTDYHKLSVGAKSGRAKSPSDPNLLLYNCTDVATTLALYEYTWSQIGKEYGRDSAKFSDACAYMRNAILWTTLELERAGIAMDIPQLKELDTTYRKKCKQCIEGAKVWGVIIKGEDSQKSTLKFMEECLNVTGLRNDPRVKLTEKKKEVSVGEDNFNLLLANTDNLTPLQLPVIEYIQGHHKFDKLVTSYTNKLLNQPREGIVHSNITYPGWFPWPSLAAKYGGKEKEKVGGTLQGRFACHKPAAQTYPPPIKKCITSRSKGGRIRSWDLSQIELRVAALLSGDPVMIKEYKDGIDRHTNTALFFFPDADVTSDEFLRKPDGQRQCGKTTNFLVLYKGGATKLRETIMRDLGIEVDYSRCVQAIAAFDARYPHFRRWQDFLLGTVARQGYIELITGWSRYWGKGHEAANANINEICDFPIQTTAAQILQGAHYEMEKDRQALKLRSVFILQQHDSLYVDEYPGETEIITEIIKKSLTNPPIYDIICAELGRTVPLEFEEE